MFLTWFKKNSLQLKAGKKEKTRQVMRSTIEPWVGRGTSKSDTTEIKTNTVISREDSDITDRRINHSHVFTLYKGHNFIC